MGRQVVQSATDVQGTAGTGTVLLLQLDLCFSVLFARDSLWLCALNSATSLVAGFAVFSILGFMAHQQGVTMDNVVESGTHNPFLVHSWHA